MELCREGLPADSKGFGRVRTVVVVLAQRASQVLLLEPGHGLVEWANLDGELHHTTNALGEIFGKEVGREVIGRLRERDLIAPGPRSPSRGAAFTFVTTKVFLLAFDLRSLDDLSDREVTQGEQW